MATRSYKQIQTINPSHIYQETTEFYQIRVVRCFHQPSVLYLYARTTGDSPRNPKVFSTEIDFDEFIGDLFDEVLAKNLDQEEIETEISRDGSIIREKTEYFEVWFDKDEQIFKIWGKIGDARFQIKSTDRIPDRIDLKILQFEGIDWDKLTGNLDEAGKEQLAIFVESMLVNVKYNRYTEKQAINAIAGRYEFLAEASQEDEGMFDLSPQEEAEIEVMESLGEIPCPNCRKMMEIPEDLSFELCSCMDGATQRNITRWEEDVDAISQAGIDVGNPYEEE